MHLRNLSNILEIYCGFIAGGLLLTNTEIIAFKRPTKFDLLTDNKKG
jgi:hypothetical protein